MKKLLILIVFLLTPLIYSNAPDSLVGAWQDSENMASGWSNTFVLSADGTYKFFTNQMDCSQRLVSYGGKWRVSDVEEAIHLTVETRRVINGGTMQKSDGSCGSDSMLTGGTQVNMIVNPAEDMDYALSKVYTDETKGLIRKFIYIDAIKYWYMSNPDEALKQLEGK